MRTELLLDAKAQLGESPLWDEREQVLYWVDILGRALHRYNPATDTDAVFNVGQHVGTVILDEQGDVLLAVENGFARFDLETETVTMLADVEADMPENRFNDGKASPAGRFWAGTMAYEQTPNAGSLYCLDIDGTVTPKKRDLTISNGIVWTSDHQTMYLVDSSPRVIYAYDYDKATGALSQQRLIIKVPESMGSPDGMAIDSEGQLWVAHWGYGKVVCWCPIKGEPLQAIDVPAEQVTACAFGGDDLQTLYITTARDGLSDEQLTQQPHAGGLFTARTEVKGTLSYRYRGTR